VDCAAVDADACSASGCATSEGRPIEVNVDELCITYGDSQPASCFDSGGDTDVACDDAITYASSSVDADCWRFSNSCIPDGWSECVPSPYPECETTTAPPDCSLLSVETCAATDGCYSPRASPAWADEYGEVCVDYDAPLTPRGCIPGRSCSDAPATAFDPAAADTLWHFYDDCIPTGWETWSSFYHHPACD